MINQSIYFPQTSEIKQWSQTNGFSTNNSVATTTTTTLTTFAIGILSSSYLAYKSPGNWWLSILSLSVISLYTLPKILNSGKPTLIKKALIANLTALGCLALGGICTATLSLNQSILFSLKTFRVSSSLLGFFLSTGLIGYGTPIFYSALKNAYNFLHNPNSQNRLMTLSEKFFHQEFSEWKISKKNCQESFILHLNLFKPKFILDFCSSLDFSLPHYAWPIAATALETPTPNQLNQILNDMETITGDLSSGKIFKSDEMEENYSLAIEIILQSLNKKELPQAIEYLVKNGPLFSPKIISKERFFNLFKDDVLDEMNKAIKELLFHLDKWKGVSKKYQILTRDVPQFLSKINKLNLQQLSEEEEEEEEINQCYEDLKKDCAELRQEVENIFKRVVVWKHFASLCQNDVEIPFEQKQDLLTALDNQVLLKEIDETYRALIGTLKGQTSTIFEQLELINNKIIASNDEENDEDISAIIYLAANQGFIQTDYNDLQLWLGVDSPHDLESAMEKIGLAIEEDLYEQNILPRKIAGAPHPSKQEIRNNLRLYIEKAPKPLLTLPVQSKNEIKENSPLDTTMKKLARFIFTAISSGLILVPIFSNPYLGATGFALGFCFFKLERFGFPGIEAITNIGNTLMEASHLSFIIHPLFNRRVFPLSQRRERAQLFANSSLLDQIRMLNTLFLCPLIISSIRLSSASHQQSLLIGSFLQGVAFSREVEELI